MVLRVSDERKDDTPRGRSLFPAGGHFPGGLAFRGHLASRGREGWRQWGRKALDLRKAARSMPTLHVGAGKVDRAAQRKFEALLRSQGWRRVGLPITPLPR